MGRNPLPSKAKELRGTKRKCREPKGDIISIELVAPINCPPHLKGVARQIYEQKVTQCFAMGILAEIDADALAIYAWEYAELIRLAQELQDEGYTYEVTNKNGEAETKLNPKEKVVRNKIAVVNAIGSQFGWSPVSRMRLQAIAKEDEKKDDFNDMLNG